jgi:hypothetical protein
MSNGLPERKEKEMKTGKDYSIPVFEKNRTYTFTRIGKSTHRPGERDRATHFVYDRSIVGATYMASFHHAKAKWRETFTLPQLRDYEVREDGKNAKCY